MSRAAALLLLAGCAETSNVFVVGEAVSYGNASSVCERESASLADVERVGLQSVYDAWIATSEPTEGVWVATRLVTNEGDERGYVMLRGGALVPVEPSGTRVAFVACERR